MNHKTEPSANDDKNKHKSTSRIRQQKNVVWEATHKWRTVNSRKLIPLFPVDGSSILPIEKPRCTPSSYFYFDHLATDSIALVLFINRQFLMYPRGKLEFFTFARRFQNF